MKIKNSFSKKTIIRIINLITILVLILSNFLLFVPETNAASYNQVVINANANNSNGISAFPASYQTMLNKLVSDTGHTNWKFKAFYTDIDWNELVSTSNENACYRNTVYKGNDSRWYCSASHTKSGYGGDGYYCASGRLVNYYLDPRNFLSEATIFQFLDLSNSSPASLSDIQSALNGSFMQGNTNTGESYAQVIYDAAEASGENALSIIIKIFQEIGKGSPGNPPSMAAGSSGYYNFFNYGATDGTGATVRGIEYAKSAGWNTQRKAIVEGAKLISNSYIKAGQNTKYTFKFDVVGTQKSELYTHQYMTNVQDPTNQSKMLFDKYTNNGWLNNELTFIIPVYKNMPTYVKKPTNLTSGSLYYVSSSYNSVTLRSGAGTSYTSLGTLARDTVVQMVQQNVATANGYTWSKIKTETGTVGYFANTYLMPVNTTADTYSVPSQPSSTTSTSANATSNYKEDGSKIIVEPGTTLKNIKENYTVTSAKKDGENIGDTDYLGTGSVIVTSKGTFTIAKIGDVSGDGQVDARDAARILKYSVNQYQIKDEYLSAADVNKDGDVDARDAARILKYSVNQYQINI